jgi:hypothetical protein
MAQNRTFEGAKYGRSSILGSGLASSKPISHRMGVRGSYCCECHNEGEDLNLACAICEIRKEKRFCPAIHGRICPQCCGEQREVTLDCPSECPYLQQAREHEKPRPASQFDAASLFLQVEVSEQFTYEHEHLLMGLSYALMKAAHADRTLNDRDLIAALSAMCTSYERLVNSGLHYEQPLTSAAQHAVAAQIEQMMKQYREAEQKQLGYSTLKDSDVLKSLVFLLRLAHGRTSGRPKSRAFIDFLASQFPEEKSAIVSPAESSILDASARRVSSRIVT